MCRNGRTRHGQSDEGSEYGCSDRHALESRSHGLPLTGGRVQAALTLAANERLASHDGIRAPRTGR